ncbi:MAG: hypothetical protein IPP14_12165 [Planctomycetes bacterium]|nr:hypothetical protein [Planctomycetota bacterium]
MKFAFPSFLALACLIAGCGSNGITFNGQKDLSQLDIRKTPVVHYNLPSETPDPVTGDPVLDITKWTGINLVWQTFTEQPSPGNDLWPQAMDPANPMGAWTFVHDQYKTPGAGWPHPSINTTPPNPSAAENIAAWTLSLQNQWFLRDINGAVLASVVPNQAPVTYESAGYASMPISIHELSQGTAGLSPLLQANPPTSAQQEVGDPATFGANGLPRVLAPIANVLQWIATPNAAPAGLIGTAWREPPGQNLSIETNAGTLVGVPVPDYFGGGGPISADGGVYMTRFSDNWQQTTAGQASTTNINDGVTYSYYLSVIGCHLMGYGLGLQAGAFALPAAITNEEHIMNTSVIFDLTAFIATGKKFQFLGSDLLKMQDVVSGTWQAPGANSTLPGKGR